MVTRIEPLTTEQSAEWQKRKVDQWGRLSADEKLASKLAEAGITLSMVQTKNTFVVHCNKDGEPFDELLIGDPGKTVPRDDRLFNLRKVDLDDVQIATALIVWSKGQKLPPPQSRIE